MYSPTPTKIATMVISDIASSNGVCGLPSPPFIAGLDEIVALSNAGPLTTAEEISRSKAIARFPGCRAAQEAAETGKQDL